MHCERVMSASEDTVRRGMLYAKVAGGAEVSAECCSMPRCQQEK